MKGIIKLFCGLAIMTLVSVGLKVDLRAASAPVVDVSINAGGNAEVSFDFTSGAFPEYDNVSDKVGFKFVSTVYEGTTPLGDTLTVELIYDGTETDPDKRYQYTFNGTTYYVDHAELDKQLVTKAQINSHLEGLTASIVNLKVSTTAEKITGTGWANPKNSPATPSDKERFAAALVTVKATYDGLKSLPTEAKTVYFDPYDEFYLIKGQSQDVNFTTTPGKGYDFTKWWEGDTGMTDTCPHEVTMGEAPITVSAEFNKRAGAVSANFGGMKILSGGTSAERSLTLNGYATSDIEGIYIDENLAGKLFPTAGKIQIIAPTTAATIKGKVIAKMYDGLEYELGTATSDATVIPSITFTLPATYSFAPGTNTNKIEPTYNITPTSVSYTPASPTSIFSYTPTAASATGVLTVTTNSNASGSVQMEATARFDDIEGGETTSVTKKASTTVKVESLILKDAIFVNKNLSIYLSKFIKSGSADATTTVTKYPSIIKVDPTTGKVSSIKITGDTSDKKDDSMTISTQTGDIDVTVYPIPQLTIETSTSGPYKYTVKMPKGLYHDDIIVSDLAKAVLQFKAPDNDDKTYDVKIDSFSEDSSDKLAKKTTKSIELKDLNKYLKEICKEKDSQTVSVTAYACKNDDYGKDDKVYSEKREFTVYRIILDTSGNATYTVNGENVGSYFYGISDATYTIKSSATNGGKLDTKNSGEFTSDSISYKVLGAKTLKAVYKADSSNTPSGSGSEDYDDVPKTGESKADIWILWSVLFISILGAGFMIWKRFGLVRAIAEADEEVAAAEFEEKVNAAKKEKEDKMKMLKDLRNL